MVSQGPAVFCSMFESQVWVDSREHSFVMSCDEPGCVSFCGLCHVAGPVELLPTSPPALPPHTVGAATTPGADAFCGAAPWLPTWTLAAGLSSPLGRGSRGPRGTPLAQGRPAGWWWSLIPWSSGRSQLSVSWELGASPALTQDRSPVQSVSEPSAQHLEALVSWGWEDSLRSWCCPWGH